MIIKTINAKLDNKELILLDLHKYKGLVTLQYLPNGGIQMVTDTEIIINTEYGFLSTSKVIFDNIEMDVKTFKKKYPNLVNTVLDLGE